MTDTDVCHYEVCFILAQYDGDGSLLNMSGPSSGVNCSHLMSSDHSDENAPALWSYALCPDIDECRLALHNCHIDAECHNTPTSFYCECQRGYAGDGVTTCNRTLVSLCYKCRALLGMGK